MGFVRLSVLAQALLLSLANADASNLNPKGNGCVNPSGYLQCYQKNIDQLSDCMTNAKKTCDGDSLQECELACGNVQLAANIGCWLTDCWNEVYSCAYQGTALQYLEGADRVQGSLDIPYYPAPDNAPGGCGYVWGNFTVTYVQQSNVCEAYDIVSAGLSTATSCECCLESSILSNIIETCPHNDLSDLSIDIMVKSFELGYNQSASDNCSILDDDTGSQCISSFSIDSDASTWYNPGQLPSGFPGTAPLSDTTDAGSLTSAPDPYTFSLFPAYTSVITPAPYNAKAVTTINTGTAVQTGTGTGTESIATGTGSASSSTTSKGAAKNIVSPISSELGVWGIAIYTMAFVIGLV
ncbi:unnamed protein product [Penicillium camemberti]|uniref:Str. FM013 n=1 Tax=Penicillium camemberti (strain FM 013) TaxID=1429867 RepID=A0A0G4PGE2_PENC3|nr:unnamed protein product [Penicillium camemberti]